MMRRPVCHTLSPGRHQRDKAAAEKLEIWLQHVRESDETVECDLPPVVPPLKEVSVLRERTLRFRSENPAEGTPLVANAGADDLVTQFPGVFRDANSLKKLRDHERQATAALAKGNVEEACSHLNVICDTLGKQALMGVLLGGFEKAGKSTVVSFLANAIVALSHGGKMTKRPVFYVVRRRGPRGKVSCQIAASLMELHEKDSDAHARRLSNEELLRELKDVMDRLGDETSAEPLYVSVWSATAHFEEIVIVDVPGPQQNMKDEPGYAASARRTTEEIRKLLPAARCVHLFANSLDTASVHGWFADWLDDGSASRTDIMYVMTKYDLLFSSKGNRLRLRNPDTVEHTLKRVRSIPVDNVFFLGMEDYENVEDPKKAAGADEDDDGDEADGAADEDEADAKADSDEAGSVSEGDDNGTAKARDLLEYADATRQRYLAACTGRDPASAFVRQMLQTRAIPMTLVDAIKKRQGQLALVLVEEVRMDLIELVEACEKLALTRMPPRSAQKEAEDTALVLERLLFSDARQPHSNVPDFDHWLPEDVAELDKFPGLLTRGAEGDANGETLQQTMNRMNMHLVVGGHRGQELMSANLADKRDSLLNFANSNRHNLGHMARHAVELMDMYCMLTGVEFDPAAILRHDTDTIAIFASKEIATSQLAAVSDAIRRVWPYYVEVRRTALKNITRSCVCCALVKAFVGKTDTPRYCNQFDSLAAAVALACEGLESQIDERVYRPMMALLEGYTVPEFVMQTSANLVDTLTLDGMLDESLSETLLRESMKVISRERAEERFERRVDPRPLRSEHDTKAAPDACKVAAVLYYHANKEMCSLMRQLEVNFLNDLLGIEGSKVPIRNARAPLHEVMKRFMSQPYTRQTFISPDGPRDCYAYVPNCGPIDALIEKRFGFVDTEAARTVICDALDAISQW